MELLKKKKDKKPKAKGIELNIDTTGMSEEEIAAMEAAKVLEQYDRESAFRNGLPKGISLVISSAPSFVSLASVSYSSMCIDV